MPERENVCGFSLFIPNFFPFRIVCTIFQLICHLRKCHINIVQFFSGIFAQIVYSFKSAGLQFLHFTFDAIDFFGNNGCNKCHASDSYKCTHNAYVNLNGNLGSENGRKHCHSLFSKGEWLVFYIRSSPFVQGRNLRP